MKTLNEVIKANECCDHGEPDSRCEDCPYNGIGACCAERETDALHYLKEYRETKKHLACLDDAEIRGDNTQVVNNPPLTWDELKSMEGKPVWIEPIKEWMLITIVSCGNIFLLGLDGLDYSLSLHDDWLLYRKERS